MAHEKVIIYTDGGSRGNPGPAGIGGVVYDREHLKEIDTVSKYIGVTTNNQAEYQALLATLEKAHKLGAKEVDCYLDSELLVKQMRQEYKVRDINLQPLFVKVWNLSMNFKRISWHHVPREKNKRADQLVNEALDAQIKMMRKDNALDVSIPME